MADQLNICSLNSEGIKSSSGSISSFFNSNDCDILCLQEVWLLQCNIKELSTINDNYLYTGVSGVDDGEKIIQGQCLRHQYEHWYDYFQDFVNLYAL